jgi:hypothetical protein
MGEVVGFGLMSFGEEESRSLKTEVRNQKSELRGEGRTTSAPTGEAFLERCTPKGELGSVKGNTTRLLRRFYKPGSVHCAVEKAAVNCRNP